MYVFPKKVWNLHFKERVLLARNAFSFTQICGVLFVFLLRTSCAPFCVTLSLHERILLSWLIASVQMSPLPQKIIPIYFKGRGDVCTQARGGFAPRSKVLTFYVPHIQFWTEKVSLSYTLHWHMIPLLHTKFMTLHRFQINHSHDYTRKFSWLHQ